MVSTALLRAQLEASLAERAPGAFTFKAKQASEFFPSGVTDVDALLDGGIPRGGITEITGSSTTGRTTLALSLIAQLTRRGRVCAWVDVQDALDPQTAAAHGICLERLLWLRIANGAIATSTPPRSYVEKTEIRLTSPSAQRVGGLHPRNETRVMDVAISQLFQGQSGPPMDKKFGTPVSPNRILEFAAVTPRCAESQPHRRKLEQTAPDRLPPRRGQAVLHQHANRHGLIVDPQRGPSPSQPIQTAKPRPRLDEALRATDLLLQAGGFGAIVLDMSDTRPEQILRIPIASWYRFRLAAEQSQAALILLTQTSCAKSCASLVLRCDRAGKMEEWRDGTETALFTGLRYRINVERKRTEGVHPMRKKPSASETTSWHTLAPWAR